MKVIVEKSTQSGKNEFIKEMDRIRKSQASVSDEKLVETREVISQEYICKKGLGILAIRYYPIIIKAIDELLDHRAVKVE